MAELEEVAGLDEELSRLEAATLDCPDTDPTNDEAVFEPPPEPSPELPQAESNEMMHGTITAPIIFIFMMEIPIGY